MRFLWNIWKTESGRYKITMPRGSVLGKVRQCMDFRVSIWVAMAISLIFVVTWHAGALRRRISYEAMQKVLFADDYDYAEGTHGHQEDKHSPNFGDSKVLRLRYKPPNKSNITKFGSGFYMQQDLLTSMHMPPKKFFYLSRKSAENFVFVTAASSSYFEESQDAIGSIQHHVPGYRIFYYDLGLTSHQINILRSLCHVHYRKFHFGAYPQHVTDLDNFAWKQLIIAEILREFEGAFWIDTSIRLKSGGFNNLYTVAIHSGGIVHLKATSHSNYATTDPNTYRYLPTDTEAQKQTRQASNAAFLVYNTDHLFWNVLIWWYMCALEPGCQGSGDLEKCHFKHSHLPKWQGKYNASCTTFDQSVLNLLESNYFGYEKSLYPIDEDDIVDTPHGAATRFKLKKC